MTGEERGGISVKERLTKVWKGEGGNLALVGVVMVVGVVVEMGVV